MTPRKLLLSALAISFTTILSAQTFSPNAIGVCSSPDKWEVAKNAGCVFVEGGVGGVLMPDKSDAEFEASLAKMNAAGVKIGAFNLFLPGSLKTTGPNADPKAALAWAETAFARAQKTGAKVIVFGSGGSRNIPDGFSYQEAWKQFSALLKEMGPIARKYGITVAIEHLNKKQNGSNFINSLSETVDLVKEVNDPNIMCLCDTFHMLVDGESAESILKADNLIAHVHVAELEGRAAPGVNKEDLSPYYDALKKVGYKGLISMECGWKDFPTELEIGVKELQKYFVE